MAKFHLTKKAVEDLADIWNYTVRNWSEKQADNYYEMLIDCCRELAKRPDLGKSYEIITPDLFGFNTSRHIIFYRILAPKEIEVIRILHEMMDLKSRL